VVDPSVDFWTLHRSSKLRTTGHEVRSVDRLEENIVTTERSADVVGVAAYVDGVVAYVVFDEYSLTSLAWVLESADLQAYRNFGSC